MRTRGERRNERASLLPFSTRQLQSLIRLSQARAKAELKPRVSAEHAQETIALMSYCLAQQSSSPSSVDPKFSASRRSGGKAASMRKLLSTLAAFQGDITLQDLRALYERSEFAASASFPTFDVFVDSLNNSGQLLKNPNKTYRVVV